MTESVVRFNEGIWVDISKTCPLDHSSWQDVSHLPYGNADRAKRSGSDAAHPDGCLYFSVPYTRPVPEPLEVSEFIEHASEAAAQETWYSVLTEILSEPIGTANPSYNTTTLYFNQPGTRESIARLDVRVAQPNERLVRYLERVSVSDMVQWHKIKAVLEICRKWEIPVE